MISSISFFSTRGRAERLGPPTLRQLNHIEIIRCLTPNSSQTEVGTDLVHKLYAIKQYKTAALGSNKTQVHNVRWCCSYGSYWVPQDSNHWEWPSTKLPRTVNLPWIYYPRMFSNSSHSPNQRVLKNVQTLVGLNLHYKKDCITNSNILGLDIASLTSLAQILEDHLVRSFETGLWRYILYKVNLW